MPREVTVPVQTLTEEIAVVEEAVGVYVRVTVGILKSDGAFDLSIPVKEYRIMDEYLTELNGPPTEWAPDKPNGTYRNQDLWHFIDILRNTNA
jgi:hypothetical protein